MQSPTSKTLISKPCLFFALAIVLTACLPTPEPLPTLVVIPTTALTASKTPLPATSTATATPDPPTPTPTLAPTLTPTPASPAYDILYLENSRPMIAAGDGTFSHPIDLGVQDESTLFSISPDNQLLAFYHGGVIYTYNLVTGEPPQPFITAAYVKALRWKPDSLTLLFAIYPRGGKEMGGGVWSYGFADIDPINHANATEAMGDWGAFAFSPDGRWAALCGRPGVGGHICGEGLFILDIGLRLAKPVDIPELCDAATLVWSPDGSRLAVACNPDVGIGAKIFSVDPASLKATQLTPNRWSDSGPAWSPDGSLIAFRSCVNQCTIWIMDAADGTKRREIGAPIVGTGRLLWTPDGDLLAAVRQERNFEPGLYRIFTDSGGAVKIVGGEQTRLIGLVMKSP